MIKHIALVLAAALALTALSATACPLEDAKKAGTSQPTTPAKPSV